MQQMFLLYKRIKGNVILLYKTNVYEKRIKTVFLMEFQSRTKSLCTTNKTRETL